MTRPEEAARLCEQGLRNRDIAKRMGISASTVANYLDCAGVGRRRDSDWEHESPAVQRARVERELSEGKRCRVCWLLLPCDDHQP